MDSAVADDRYVAEYESARFQALRRRSNAFIAGASIVFYGWWFVGIALAAFAPGVFRTELGGPFNVGLLFLLLSFVLVVAVTVAYLRFASSRLDPASEQIRVELEGGTR
ncbi:DUF485 domain-containing protein [Actinocorallia sp. API 0066]|uniref:DUF485 domain-containing protein n=1 Tax=Actinocorallia sp. API 0066 TaxID=2896846 RepID=UPI001E4E7FCC|nr:DUF485 domain-containing protein [Actinocorallia sp. API 0066]MCD0448656.1 DUF485 domain-containing protein [Actinocorallia sp. API 0066]